MNRNAVVYVALFLLSASVLCFEIVATRIASVIFVQDYAYIILSLALLGLGAGGVGAFYMIRPGDPPFRIVRRLLMALGALYGAFVAAVIVLSVTSPLAFLLLVFAPFLASGAVYAQIYKTCAASGFSVYAADLSGAAVGSVASLGLIGWLGAPNAVLLLALTAFTVSSLFPAPHLGPGKRAAAYAALALGLAALIFNGRHELLGKVPIGDFPEKDFYYVYPDAAQSATILDSRWSIYGRADLVGYRTQDMVRQMFVDGAAGSQVYRFNGNILDTRSNLQELLLQHTNAVPFLCLTKEEKRSMLVIGPGGGKEILLGLFGEAGSITGVEVNPDFVRMVKDHGDFDGGIYTNFPNVRIVVEEGRHFVKKSDSLFDLVVMALPSTAQMQNIEPFATSENFLLTREAVRDFLAKLTPGGSLLLTVHNRWELMRLLTTAVSVFQDLGVPPGEIRHHFAVFEAEYAPTVVIKKRAFTPDEAARWQQICRALPPEVPAVTYLPFGLAPGRGSKISQFLEEYTPFPDRVETLIRDAKYDITPCTDDDPYFYKVSRGIPRDIGRLLAGTAACCGLAVWLPLKRIRRSSPAGRPARVTLPLAILACTGVGFMVLEVSLFQKFVLYLGSPTISLSILLSSLLIGMGAGSYLGKSLFAGDVRKRLLAAGIGTVAAGLLLLAGSPAVLAGSLALELPARAAICFLVILPLGFLLGMPFPACLQFLVTARQERAIPWMYGVNGAMSVLGSVLAIALSMLVGFTLTLCAGLSLYVAVSLLSLALPRRL